MSLQIIRTAFESRLKAWADTQALPIAFENRLFTAPANSRYLRAYLLAAKTNVNFLQGNDREYLGVFQVSIIQPLNAGTASAQTIALALDTLYPTSFLEGVTRIYITSPMSASVPSIEPDCYVLPVSCNFRCLT